MTRYTFNEVSVTATRRWTEGGKRRQETKKFRQTVNPFNVNKATGLPKTRDEIWAEVNAERAAWLASTGDSAKAGG